MRDGKRNFCFFFHFIYLLFYYYYYYYFCEVVEIDTGERRAWLRHHGLTKGFGRFDRNVIGEVRLLRHEGQQELKMENGRAWMK